MGEALLFGVVASSALVIGAAIGTYAHVSNRVTGILLAFASGSLFAALAFELFTDAFELGGAVRSGLGLLAGAATFVSIDQWLDRRVGDSPTAARESGSRSAVGFSLLAAVTLDGIPENLALGVSLVEGTSLVLLIAIFASNLPEALAGADAMKSEGRSTAATMGTWSGAALALTLAVVVGRVALEGVAPETLALFLSFAGGAVLASLADTLMPEAFVHGRPWNSFATAAGFFVSFLLAGG